MRSVVRMDLGDGAGALQDVEKALELDPRCGDAYLQRALLRRQESTSRSALSDLNRVLELNARSLEARLARAAFHQNLRNPEKAMEDLDAAVRLLPGEAKPYWYRAIALEMAGRLLEAFANYLHAVEIDPQYAAAWLARQVSAGARRVQLDRRPFDQAVSLHPRDARLIFFRGRCHEADHEAVLALQDYQRAIGLDATIAAAYPQRWSAHFAAAEQAVLAEVARICTAVSAAGAPGAAGPAAAPTSAVAAGEPAGQKAELRPADPSVHMRHGQELMNADDLPGAVREFSWAIDLEPRLSEAWRLRALARVRLGDRAGARTDLHKAVQADPRSVPAHRDRALFLQELGETAAALSDLESAVRLAPRDPALLRLRGRLRGIEGDPQGAHADLAEAGRIEQGTAPA
ncbi:MAG: tetratricopeptide repeat protein [Planctomycetes bacterium]|nr:tetratricopeptide repeat protein [Planctomycetota bacterium]